jgi:hypothetical protein
MSSKQGSETTKSTFATKHKTWGSSTKNSSPMIQQDGEAFEDQYEIEGFLGEVVT